MPSCYFSKTLGNGLETREGQALSPEISNAHGFEQAFALLRKAILLSMFVFLCKGYAKNLHEGIQYKIK